MEKATNEPSQLGVHLLGGIYLTVSGQRWEVPDGSCPLIAFLAVDGPMVDRRRIAAALWPTCTDSRASGNLRSALWRLRIAGCALLEVDSRSVSFGSAVRVDVIDVVDWTRRLIRGDAGEADLDPACWPVTALNLLPGWTQEWLVVERDRLRQRVLHALEAAARQLTLRGRFADAIDAAMVAIAADPLRETAHRALIDAFLAEGNRSQALVDFDRYRRLVRRELGQSPSQELSASLWP